MHELVLKFSPPTAWVPGMQLRLGGKVSLLTEQIIYPAQDSKLKGIF